MTEKFLPKPKLQQELKNLYAFSNPLDKIRFSKINLALWTDFPFF